MATTNSLFAVIAVSNPNALEERLKTIAPWLYLKVSEGEWLLIAPPSKTTKEVSDALGVSEGETTNAMVLKVENYFGRSSVATWEWIAAKQGVPLDDPPNT